MNSSRCEEGIRISHHSLKKVALLVCFRDAGHEGLHYDEADDIYWMDGASADEETSGDA